MSCSHGRRSLLSLIVVCGHERRHEDGLLACHFHCSSGITLSCTRPRSVSLSCMDCVKVYGRLATTTELVIRLGRVKLSSRFICFKMFLQAVSSFRNWRLDKYWKDVNICVCCSLSFCNSRAVVGGPAMAWPLFLPRKICLLFSAF